MDLIYFILAAYGLTQILVFGSIFNKIRPTKKWLNGFGKLFHCPMCMGFWVGIFLFGINGWTELFTFEHTIANYFVLGCNKNLRSGKRRREYFRIQIAFGELSFVSSIK